MPTQPALAALIAAERQRTESMAVVCSILAAHIERQLGRLAELESAVYPADRQPEINPVPQNDVSLEMLTS
jgi:hypothetical protein